MSSFNDSVYDEPQFLKISYRLTTQNQTLVLKLQGPSQYFFECYELNSSNSKLANCLPTYNLHQEILHKLKFVAKESSHMKDHRDLQTGLEDLLQSYGVCVLQYGHHQKIQIDAALIYLKEKSNKIMFKEIKPHHQSESSYLYGYYPVRLRQKIEQVLRHFQRYQKFNLIFSMNWFINDEIKSHSHLKFIEELVKIYTKEIKELPKIHRLKHLIVHNLMAVVVEKQKWAGDWNKKQKMGIYGIQLNIQSFDYEVSAFYGVLEKFFSLKTYCVKNLQISMFDDPQFLTQKYFKQKYDNPMIKYLPLSKSQVVILSPTEYFSRIKTQMSKVFWTIDKNFFPNCDFQQIKKRENLFRRYIKQRNILWQNMLISENMFTFYADKENYQRVKTHTRQFLFEHIEAEFKIDFISSQKELDIFMEFTFKKALLEDIELLWKKKTVFCRCLNKMTVNSYNQIKQLYDEHQQSMREVVGLHNVTHKFIDCIGNPEDLIAEKYINWKLNLAESGFEVELKDYSSLKKEEFVIFMTKDPENCLELKMLLGQEKVAHLVSFRTKYTESILQNSPMFKSIVCWNIASRSEGNYEYQQQRLFNDLMVMTYKRSKPITIAITQQIVRNTLPTLKSLIKKLIESNPCKKVVLVLSNSLPPLQRDTFIRQIMIFFNRDLRETISLDYSFHENMIQQLCTMRFHQIHWIYNQMPFMCSPLNSFVFHCQRQKTKYKARQFAVVLPKIDEVIEILVDLQSGRALENGPSGISEVINVQLKRLIASTVSIITRYFPMQNHIVLYSNLQRTSLISTIYVYDKKQPNNIKKYIIDQNNLLVSSKSTSSFTLEEPSISRYRYRTHRSFLTQLMQLMTPEQ